ncbi:sideroflexin-2-like [Pollicipes pollicipes]|uniref:sideroflexin-2-like n=1 Tax=Pollicipes pollicipes TaxID=41117 RepID=UPI001884E002|nr:sideroflexin-2-like [Pollicipes pollicipes]
MSETPREAGRLDLSRPRWDQSTFAGRLRHFFSITSPWLALHGRDELLAARDLVQQYREGREPAGTDDEQVWRAKALCDSAFHPDTGDLQNVVGRMSFQVPGGMVLIGGMITFYRSTTAVVFWQWANQSFNAFVNFTNRNAKSPLTPTQLGVAYVSATSCALGTALGLKRVLAGRASTFVQRFVPLVAVVAANCVNIPLMRQGELLHGVPTFDAKGEEACVSRAAAVKGIAQVTLSRNVIVSPSMLLLPVLMSRLDRVAWYARRTRLHAPAQIALSGAVLMFMVPVGCALFPQTCVIGTDAVRRLEPAVWQELVRRYQPQPPPDTVQFNKGL